MDEQLSQLELDDKFEKIFFELYNGTPRGINYEVLNSKSDFKRFVPQIKGRATSVSSFNILNLDLDADKYYRFFIEMEPDAASNFFARLNGDNTTANYSGTRTITGAAATDPITNGVDLANGAPGANAKFVIEFDLARRTYTTTDTWMWWKSYSLGGGANNITTGVALYNQTTNITSITFVDTSGSGANWNYSYTIYKRSF